MLNRQTVERELSLVLCDNLEGWEVQEGWVLISIVVWQKPTQHCKAIILQLKIHLKNEQWFAAVFII